MQKLRSRYNIRCWLNLVVSPYSFPVQANELPGDSHISHVSTRIAPASGLRNAQRRLGLRGANMQGLIKRSMLLVNSTLE